MTSQQVSKFQNSETFPSEKYFRIKVIIVPDFNILLPVVHIYKFEPFYSILSWWRQSMGLEFKIWKKQF